MRLSQLYTQRWYIYLASCTPLQRYVFTLSVLSVLCISWLCAVYYPLEHARCGYEHQLVQLQKQCHACSCVSGACNQLENSINAARSALKPYQSMDVCPLVRCMELAQKAGLTVHSCTMGHSAAQHDQKKELVTIEISGTTKAYMTFLNLLAQLPQIITYEHMHIEHAQVPQIRATCVLGFVMVQ
ncbi:MAG: hypothetical protein ACHQVS_02235 [Candidatus Babeliales bacterium]